LAAAQKSLQEAQAVLRHLHQSDEFTELGEAKANLLALPKCVPLMCRRLEAESQSGNRSRMESSQGRFGN